MLQNWEYFLHHHCTRPHWPLIWYDLFTLIFETLDILSLNDSKNEKTKAIISSAEVNCNNLRHKIQANQTCMGIIINFYLKKVYF